MSARFSILEISACLTLRVLASVSWVGELIRHPQHQFWPDSLSLLAESHVDASRLLDAIQLTDTYLLALAAARPCG
jgi:hypothetical protein